MTQIDALRKALAALPTFPTGGMLDDIHYGVGTGVLTNEEYFAAKLANDGLSPDRKHILFTSVLKVWNQKIREESEKQS